MTVRPGDGLGQIVVDIYLGPNDCHYTEQTLFHRLRVNADGSVSYFQRSITRGGFFGNTPGGAPLFDMGIRPSQSSDSVVQIARKVAAKVKAAGGTTASDQIHSWIEPGRKEQ